MARFTFTDASNETFVIRLTDPAAVAHARGLLAGTETGDARIAGTVVKTDVPYNIGWSYHIQDVFFFEISAEVGDSTMRLIEQDLDAVGGAFLPGSVWTGWSSVLVEELKPLHGGVGNDSLEGSQKADIVFGRAGDDILLGLVGDDHLIGAAGRDKLFSGPGDDKLAGGAGADSLSAGNGADVLVGGPGADRLSAGFDDDQDLIVYGSKAELILTDQIFQFDRKSNAAEAVWDRIDLRPVDADSQLSGDQAFRFVDSYAAAGAGEPDGQLRVVDLGRHVNVEIDFNGDNAADALIVVRGVGSLSEADFFL
jgi:Ca2+-binding RTX toxin-like protein